MDRDALARWLRTPSKTWRWNQGETHGYEAVELRGEMLVWFRWRVDDPRGEGRADELEQSLASFLADGPRRALPRSVYDAVVEQARTRSS